MATAALRNAILKQIRTIKTTTPLNPNPQFPISSVVNHVIFRRHLSSTEQTRGTTLDQYEVTDRVISVVKNFSRVDPSKVTANAHFEKDLGLGSLETVEIVMALEEEFRFEIPDEEAFNISSINMAVDYISSHPQAL